MLLATGASEVLLLHAVDGLALGELLGGALVGLADGEAGVTKSLALLGQVGKVLVVGLALVLLGLLSGGALSVGGLVLGLSGSNGVAGLLVLPLGLTLLVTPAVTGLLGVLAFEFVSESS